MNDQTTGFVLKQTDYKDTSVILNVLTKEYGSVSFVASGARKMTSRNAGNILPYSKGLFTFDYKDGKTMFRLKSAHTREMYRGMRQNLAAVSAAGVIAEAVDQVNSQDGISEISRNSFELMDQAFPLLNEGKDPSLVTGLFLAVLLRCTGIGPDVDECVSCGSLTAASISVKEGGFLCEDCASRLNTPRDSVRKLRSFRLLNKASFEQFDIIEPLIENPLEQLNLLVGFFRLHGGVELHSYEVFRKMLAIE